MRSPICFCVRAGVLVAALAFLAGCASAPSGPRIDNVPMYGQPELARPDFLVRADEDFVRNAAGLFGGDRRAASKAWCERADRYLAERNLDFAMRRYNQAWLLDAQNYEVYWGFGRVMVETDRFDEAVRFLRQAIGLCADTKQLSGLHSDLGVALSYRAHSRPRSDVASRREAFAEANAEFARAVSLDPDYANAWRRWAISLVFEEDWPAAAAKLERAQALGAAPLPAAQAQALAAGLAGS